VQNVSKEYIPRWRAHLRNRSGGFKVNGKAVTGLTTFQKKVVVDSSSASQRTSGSWVDDQVALALWDVMPGKGDDPAKACPVDDLRDPTVKFLNNESAWEVPCGGELPEFTVTAGGISITVTKGNLVVELFAKHLLLRSPAGTEWNRYLEAEIHDGGYFRPLISKMGVGRRCILRSWMLWDRKGHSH